MADLGEKFGGDASSQDTASNYNPTEEEVAFGLSVRPFGAPQIDSGPAQVTRPSQSGSLFEKFGQKIKAGTTRRDRGKGLSYVTVPALDQKGVAKATWDALMWGSSNNPYAANQLLLNPDLLGGAAEMAHNLSGNKDLYKFTTDSTNGNRKEVIDMAVTTLGTVDPGRSEFNNPFAIPSEFFYPGLDVLREHPEWYQEFADSYWADLVNAYTTTYNSATPDMQHRKQKLASYSAVKQFKSDFNQNFSNEEMDLILSLFAATPDVEDVMLQSGVDASTYGKDPVGQIALAWAQTTRAPESIEAQVNDPRLRVINLATQYLQDDKVDLSDPEQKVDFINYLMTQGNKTIGRFQDAADAGGFGSFFYAAAQPFNTAVQIVTDWASEGAAWVTNPSDYGNREALSIGEQVALSWGSTPADRMFHDASGVGDIIADLTLDPTTYLFAYGSALKAARSVPRVASKATTIAEAFKPIWFRSTELFPTHVMNSNVSTRIFYSFLSKDVDTLVDLGRNQAMWRWIAETDSATAIAERFPSLKRTGTLKLLEEANTVDEVKFIVRDAMHGGETFSETTQSIYSRITSGYRTAREKLSDSRRSVIATDGLDFNVNSLHGDLDAVHGDDIFELADTANPGRLGPEAFDEGVTGSVVRSERVFEKGEEVATLPIKNGEVRIVRNGSNVGAYVDGEFVGAARGLNTKAPDIAVIESQRDRGIGKALMDVMTPQELDNLKNAPIKSGAAERLLGVKKPVVLTRRALDGSGGGATVLSTLGGGRVLRVKDDKATWKIVQWLDSHADDTNGYSDTAALISGGGNLGQLNEKDIAALEAYLRAEGYDALSLGNHAFVGSKSNLEMIHGVDGAYDDAATMSKRLPQEYNDVITTNVGQEFMAKDLNADIFVILDLPNPKFSSKIWDFGRVTGSKLPDRWARRLREVGFGFKHRNPQNIDMISTSRVRQEVHDWSKAMGMDPEFAQKWADKIADTAPLQRKEVLDEWLLAVGDKANNPFLKYNLYSRVQKGGVQTFETNVNGVEIGKARDGSVTPMTLSHLANTYMMPDVKELVRAQRRYAQKRPFQRGILRSTKDRRSQIMDSIIADLRGKGYKISDKTSGVRAGSNVIAKEDVARMAYADVIGAEKGALRGAGAGYVNKIANGARDTVYGFGSLFTIAQLAGRPVAWNSRYLIEESIRSLMMGDTAMLRNPIAFFDDVWDAAAIRRMEQLKINQLKELAKLTDDMWAGGDLTKLAKAFPDINMEGWTKGDVASLLSREYGGSRKMSGGFVGSRFSPYRKAYKNNNRIAASRSRIEKYKSIDENFRWKIDAAEIANRSFVNDFTKEAGASTIPIRWNPSQMTPFQIRQAGEAMGRQVKQMMEDPVIGRFGVGRMSNKIDNVDPNVAFGPDALVGSSHWGDIAALVDRRLTGDGIDVTTMTARAKAEWYLENVVDQISESLFRPLIVDATDDAMRVQILKDLRNMRAANVPVGDKVLTLNLDHYAEAKGGFARFAEEAALDPNRAMPHTIAAYFDPRFGERAAGRLGAKARKWVDREMMFFGEQTTQALHRQPAYLRSRENFYNRYIRMGWSEDTARAAAAERAAIQTNFVFFDNSAIPQVLHDMNKIIPFFSAMWEVGQTWLYKIPMMNYYGLGLGHLVHRVDRTLKGMQKAGLVDYDGESGQMTFTATNDPDNDPVLVNAIQGITFGLMKTPIHIMEWAAGLSSIMSEEGYQSKDFSAWYKDGFKFGVGNPINPTSYGVMAVNQFSVGFTPAIQLLASNIARNAYAWDDEIQDVEDGTTLGDYMLANPEADPGAIMAYNEAAFIDANGGKENFKRAQLQQSDPTELKMPAAIRLPKTSWWESMLDATIFPFGKYRSGKAGVGDLIAAPIPAAMSYIARGWGMTGQGDTNDWLGLLFGNISSYQAHSELATQIMMLEASEGLLTKERAIANDITRYKENHLGLGVINSGGVKIAKGGTDEERDELQNLLDDLADTNHQILRRATANAAGGLFTRGMLGLMGPVSPRSYVKEQEVVANYWAGKDMAEEYAKGHGSLNLPKVIASNNIGGMEDMTTLASITQAWIEDSSGDAAKEWLTENMPGLTGFLQGKSFYGTVGLSGRTEAFEDWNAGVEDGTITGVPPEVFIMRAHQAGISNDRQFAIVHRYGNDVDLATQRILSNRDDYNQLTDDFNLRYESVDFLDTLLYGSALKNYYNRAGVDAITEVSLVEDNLREMQDAMVTMDELLRAGDLSPKQKRDVKSDFGRTMAEYRRAYGEYLNDVDPKYQNPLERNLSEYYTNVYIPHWEERSKIYDELIDTAENREELNNGYEKLREYDDQAYVSAHYIQSVTGEQVPVPSPLEYQWNSRSESEKADLLYANLSKPASRMNQFEVDALTQQFPEAEPYLPNGRSLPIHDWKADQIAIIRRLAREHPTEWSTGKKNNAIEQVNETFRYRMIGAGRKTELDYEDSVPLHQMALVGALPPSLAEVSDRFNIVLNDLRSQDKSPLSDYGKSKVIQFVDKWLQPIYFVQNPKAMNDFIQLGDKMYGEAELETLYGILLQGRTPLSLKLG